jgi:16S rRNA G1207 methylase RsmC
MQHEPTHIEILITKLVFLLYGKSIYKAFADHLPIIGNERVLDFGCGMGTVAYYISKRLLNGDLTCLDISERWLKICRKTLQGCENVCFLNTVELLKESFDMIYCHLVLHDISDNDLETVVSALVKSLKSGGVLIFREPLNESEKLKTIKRLIEQNKLSLKYSRITDIPLVGNTLESIYTKK